MNKDELFGENMADTITQSNIMKALDFCYEKSINGVPGLGTAQSLAEEYLKGEGNLSKKIDRLIKYQIAKAGTSGFLTGLGGLLLMPITIPANLSSVWYVQIRMIAAIAYMRGYDIKNDKVKTLVYACLCGSAAADVVKNAGIQVGTKLSISAINKISGATLTKINQAVGFRLLTKFGQTGIVNLGKAVPLVGGVIGGGIDVATTYAIGKAAKEVFSI